MCTCISRPVASLSPSPSLFVLYLGYLVRANTTFLRHRPTSYALLPFCIAAWEKFFFSFFLEISNTLDFLAFFATTLSRFACGSNIYVARKVFQTPSYRFVERSRFLRKTQYSDILETNIPLEKERKDCNKKK